MQERIRLNLRLLISLLSIILGIVLMLFPPALLTAQQSKAAALSVVIISLWATGIIPEYLTALFLFLFAMLFAVAPPSVIFSGFESTAMWLVFGGIVIGVGITETGLGSRIAGKIVERLSGGYFRLIGGIVVVGVLFSFFMPSALGRSILLTPIALAIAKDSGFIAGSNGRTGIVLAAILGASIPACAIMPANVVNLVLVGMAENQFDLSLLYGEYLLLHFPVLGVVKALVIIGLIMWLYPDKPQKKNIESLTAANPMTRDERLLSIVVATLLALWMTDFLHHISPAWVALGGALFILLPGINIVDSRLFNQKVNYGSLFFLAGILGFGGMVGHTGLGDTLAGKLIAALPLGQSKPFLNFILLGLTSMLTGIIATVAGVPAILTPLSDTLSQATGLPIKSVLMIQVLGFSTIIFPFYAPAILIGLQMAGEKLSASIKVCSVLALITIFLLWPIDYLWWKVLGWL